MCLLSVQMSPHISPEPYTLHNAILAVNIENMLHIVTRVTVPLILDLSSSITPCCCRCATWAGTARWGSAPSPPPAPAPGSSARPARWPSCRYISTYLHIYTIQVVCHEACQTKLLERLGCKRTFVEGARNYRDHPGAAVQSICRVQSG